MTTRRLVIPSSAFGPEIIRVFAEDLEESIRWCGANGIRVPASGRQRIGARLLRDWADTWDQAGPTPITVELRHAATLAVDFVHAMEAMRDGIPPGLIETISRVTRGSLSGGGGAAAYSAQTELYVATWALFSGFRVGSPEPAPAVGTPAMTETREPAHGTPASSRRPEFVLTLGEYQYVAEVKCASTVQAAKRSVQEAAKQMREFREHLPGVVFVDVGPLLDAPDKTDQFDEADINRRLRHVGDEVQDILKLRTVAERLAHVILLVLFARRVVPWHLSAGIRTYLPVRVIDNPNAFGRQAQGQIVQVMRMIRTGTEQMAVTRTKSLGVGKL